MAKIFSKTVGNSDTQQSLLYCLGHLGWHNTERIISILCCVSLSPAFLPWKQCHWLGGMPLLLIWPMWCLFGPASLLPEWRHFLFTSGIINLPLYKHWCMLFESNLSHLLYFASNACKGVVGIKFIGNDISTKSESNICTKCFMNLSQFN